MCKCLLQKSIWVTFFVNFVLIYALSGRSLLVNRASAQNAVELCGILQK